MDQKRTQPIYVSLFCIKEDTSLAFMLDRRFSHAHSLHLSISLYLSISLSLYLFLANMHPICVNM